MQLGLQTNKAFRRKDYNRLENFISEEDLSSWRRIHICYSKLKHAAEITSVMTYFAVIAAVEVNIRTGDARPILITAMVIATSLLVSTTMVLKFVCCSILPYIESVIAVSEIKDVCRSPHDYLFTTINTTWILACVVGPVLFILDLILLIWIKFEVFTFDAAYAATAILSGLLISMGIFGIVLYRLPKHHSSKHRYHLLTPRGSKEELTIISIDSSSGSENSSSSSICSYSSAKTSLINNSHLSSLYGATETSDTMLFLSFTHAQNVGV